MRFLVIGNMGYVGPSVVAALRAKHPDAIIDGVDNAYFAHCLTGVGRLPESKLNRQIFADVRTLSQDLLRGYDAVVQLAAISNDPMGDRYAAVTADINQDATVNIARMAERVGVQNFVFASSCSVYGVADGPARRETDPLNPATAYARSKIGAEQELVKLTGDMTVTSLRFATACGMSDRLRLDLVLNDFVACALSDGKITVLSDGSPWRPLIDVADMGRAIEWAATRLPSNGGKSLVVNVGANTANYQIRDLAKAVGRHVPNTEVSINTDAPADSRSYKVDFSKFAELAPDHQPLKTLDDSIRDLIDGMRTMGFNDADFRSSQLIRLKVLERHVASGRLSTDLQWSGQQTAPAVTATEPELELRH